MSTGHEAGYSKPPVAHQFKKGQSGNPKGRPKGAKGKKSFLADLNAELQKTITFNEGGKVKKITKQQALAKCLIQQCMTGNAATKKFVLELIEQLEHMAAAGAPSGADMPAAFEWTEEDAKLDHFLAQNTKPETPPESDNGEIIPAGDGCGEPEPGAGSGADSGGA